MHKKALEHSILNRLIFGAANIICMKHESDWFKPCYTLSCRAKDPREASIEHKVPEHRGSVILLTASSPSATNHLQHVLR